MGFAAGDLALKVPLARENGLERQANAMRICSTVYQKRRRTFAAGYLRNQLLDLWPRSGPFLPEKQRYHCE